MTYELENQIEELRAEMKNACEANNAARLRRSWNSLWPSSPLSKPSRTAVLVRSLRSRRLPSCGQLLAA